MNKINHVKGDVDCTNVTVHGDIAGCRRSNNR